MKLILNIVNIILIIFFRHGGKNDSIGPGPGQYNVTGLSAKGIFFCFVFCINLKIKIKY